MAYNKKIKFPKGETEMKKVLVVIAVLAVLFSGATGTFAKKAKKVKKADFTSAEQFETALNQGQLLTGKTVTFIVTDLKPDSAFGYNVVTGEHLNFVSSTNPGVEIGNELTVKVGEVTSFIGSYIIEYKLKKVNKSKTKASEAAPVKPLTEEEQELAIEQALNTKSSISGQGNDYHVDIVDKIVNVTGPTTYMEDNGDPFDAYLALDSDVYDTVISFFPDANVITGINITFNMERLGQTSVLYSAKYADTNGNGILSDEDPETFYAD